MDCNHLPEHLMMKSVSIPQKPDIPSFVPQRDGTRLAYISYSDCGHPVKREQGKDTGYDRTHYEEEH